MLPGIQMHTVNAACGRDRSGIEKQAVMLRRNAFKGRSQARCPLLGPFKFWRHLSFGFLKGWRRNNQNLRDRHARLHRGTANCANDRTDALGAALSGMPVFIGSR